MIPLFRRWPSSVWRDVLYTGIWNALIALFLAAAAILFSGQRSFMDFFIPNLIISNIVGYLIHAVLVLCNWLLRGWPINARGLLRIAYYLAVVGLCVVVGIALGDSLLRGANPLRFTSRLTALAPLLPFALFMAAFMVVVMGAGERRLAADTLAARQSEQIASAAQLLAEARLRALQAQIEPHFLYNTLANVVGLIDTDPAQARHMLERFIDFLRASLAASRAEQSTLGAEADLISAYLDVLSVRMGARLRYRIDIGADCRDTPIAPMLLQPIVENAVTHGLEPKIEGGLITVRAQRQGELLAVEVSDTGAGLTGDAPRPGGGLGLGNIRARLRSLYGSEAQVQLIENQPCGMTVRLMLPLKATPPSTLPAP